MGSKQKKTKIIVPLWHNSSRFQYNTFCITFSLSSLSQYFTVTLVKTRILSGNLTKKVFLDLKHKRTSIGKKQKEDSVKTSVSVTVMLCK